MIEVVERMHDIAEETAQEGTGRELVQGAVVKVELVKHCYSKMRRLDQPTVSLMPR